MIPNSRHQPSKYLTGDGLAAVRLTHFGGRSSYWRPAQSVDEERVSAFSSYAVKWATHQNAVRDDHYFTSGFNGREFVNRGPCGTNKRHSIVAAGQLLNDADESEWFCKEGGGGYEIRTLRRWFYVTDRAGEWDLIENIRAGTISLSTERMTGSPAALGLLADFTTAEDTFKFWRERRRKPAAPTNGIGTVPDDWKNAREIPVGYLELELLSI